MSDFKLAEPSIALSELDQHLEQNRLDIETYLVSHGKEKYLRTKNRRYGWIYAAKCDSLKLLNFFWPDIKTLALNSNSVESYNVESCENIISESLYMAAIHGHPRIINQISKYCKILKVHREPYSKFVITDCDFFSILYRVLHWRPSDEDLEFCREHKFNISRCIIKSNSPDFAPKKLLLDEINDGFVDRQEYFELIIEAVKCNDFRIYQWLIEFNIKIDEKEKKTDWAYFKRKILYTIAQGGNEVILSYTVEFLQEFHLQFSLDEILDALDASVIYNHKDFLQAAVKLLPISNKDNIFKEKLPGLVALAAHFAHKDMTGWLMNQAIYLEVKLNYDSLMCEVVDNTNFSDPTNEEIESNQIIIAKALINLGARNYGKYLDKACENNNLILTQFLIDHLIEIKDEGITFLLTHCLELCEKYKFTDLKAIIYKKVINFIQAASENNDIDVVMCLFDKLIEIRTENVIDLISSCLKICKRHNHLDLETRINKEFSSILNVNIEVLD